MQNLVFRVFVSSTFHDIAPYRDALQKNVYGSVDSVCAAHKATFHPIDLRWGIGREIEKNNEVLKTCLYEVERCKELSPRPSMLILIRNSYGWTPPPYEIPEEDFDLILAAAHEMSEEKSEARQMLSDAVALLQKWYEKNENRIPSVYEIKKRYGMFVDDQKAWEKEENQLCESIRFLISFLGFADAWPYDRLVRYQASATEQEIYHGLLKDPAFGKQVIAVFIEDFPEEEDPRITALKDRIRTVLPKDRLFIKTREHSTKDLCRFVNDTLSDVILAELNGAALFPPFMEEEMIQSAFAEKERRCYVHRSCEEAFARSVDGANGRITVLSGASGCGKTALMANYIAMRPVIYAFCDASFAAQNVLPLTEYLIRQVYARGGISDEIPVLTYDNAARCFQEALQKVKEIEITVLVDCIEKISDFAKLRQSIFNIILPEKHRIVVSSSVPPERFGIGDRQNVFTVTDLSEQEVMLMFRTYLRAADRRITECQEQIIRAKAVANRSPIYITLLVSQAKAWKSTDRVDAEEIPDNVATMIAHNLRTLAGGAVGDVLFWHSLAYIAVSCYGLTDAEMLSVLRLDNEVLSESKNEYWEMEGGVIPPVLWAMAYCRIMEYTVVNLHEGHLLIKWKHALFENAVLDHFTGKDVQDFRKRVLTYFEGLPNYTGTEEARAWRLYPNTRKARELLPGLKDREWVGQFSDPVAVIEFCDLCVRARQTEFLLSVLDDIQADAAFREPLRNTIRDHLADLNSHPEDFLSIVFSLPVFAACRDAAVSCPGIVPVRNDDAPHRLYVGPIEKLCVSAEGGSYAVISGNVLYVYYSRTRTLENSVFYFDGSVEDLVFASDTIVLLTDCALYLIRCRAQQLVLADRKELARYDSLTADRFCQKVLVYRQTDPGDGLLLYDPADASVTALAYPVKPAKKTDIRIKWDEGDQFTMDYGSNICLFEICSREIKVLKKSLVGQIPFFSGRPFEFCSSKNRYCLSFCTMFRYFDGERTVRYEYYYPFAFSLETYPCTDYTVAVQNHREAELIEHKNGKAWRIAVCGEISDVLWAWDMSAFTVVYNNYRFAVYEVGVLTQGAPLLTMPRYLPSASSLQTYLTARHFKRFLPAEILLDLVEKKVNRSDVSGKQQDETAERLAHDALFLPTAATLSDDGLAAFRYAAISRVRIIDAAAEKTVYEFGTDRYQPSDPTAQRLSPSGRYYALFDGGKLRICDISSGQWVFCRSLCGESALKDMWLSDSVCRILCDNGTVTSIDWKRDQVVTDGKPGCAEVLWCTEKSVWYTSSDVEPGYLMMEAIKPKIKAEAYAMDRECGVYLALQDGEALLFLDRNGAPVRVLIGPELCSGAIASQHGAAGTPVLFKMRVYQNICFIAFPRLKMLVMAARSGEEIYRIYRHIRTEGTMLDFSVSSDGILTVAMDRDPYISRFEILP